MTLFQDSGNMTACLVSTVIFVTGSVVKVAHVRVIRYLVIELDHRVFRLADVQFREVGGIGGVGLLIQVTGQAHGTHQRAGVRGVAIGVHTAHFHEFLQPRAVILTVDTRHPYAVNVGAPGKQSLPVQVRAAVKDERLHVAPGLERKPGRGELGKVFQAEGRKRARKVGLCHRCSFGEGDALHLRPSRVQFLQFRLFRQVKRRARAATGLRLRLVTHVQLAQLPAAADREPPAGGAGRGGLKVQLAQHRAFAKVKGVLQVVGGTGHVENTHAARAIHAQRVVHRIGTGDGKRGRLVLVHDTRTRDIGAVVCAVTEGVGLRGRDFQGVGRIVSRTGEVQVDVITREVARTVFRIQQREAVLDEVLAVRPVGTLQRVDERPHLTVHLLHGRGDVLQVARLVEGTVRPVAALFVVQHRKHPLVRHHGPEVRRAPFQIVLQVTQHQVPEPRVVPLEGVLRRFRVVGIPVRRVAVHQEAVVALAKLRVTVVVRDVPHQPVPRAQHHVLRTLVDGEEVVREEVVGQQVVTVEIAVDLRLELVAGEGRRILCIRPGGDARPDPAVKGVSGPSAAPGRDLTM